MALIAVYVYNLDMSDDMHDDHTLPLSDEIDISNTNPFITMYRLRHHLSIVVNLRSALAVGDMEGMASPNTALIAQFDKEILQTLEQLTASRIKAFGTEAGPAVNALSPLEKQ